MKDPCSKLAVTILTAFLLAISVAQAQSGGPYEIAWSTMDGGGGVSRGGPYVMIGTIGQADAGNSAGGNYEVLGGFWPGGPLCFVDFDDYARFAQYWRDSGGNLPGDLHSDGIVDWHDVAEFGYWWLYECPYQWPLR